MIKREIMGLLCAGVLVLSGCTQKTPEYIELDWGEHSEPIAETLAAAEQPVETKSEPISEISVGAEQDILENSSAEETEMMEADIDDTAYIGEYLDADVNEPNLEIAKGDDGKYIVQIGIFRLTSLSDGVGELTAEGMRFTATDASGNPIGGIITIEGETAVVTFTDSTWEYLPNGSVYRYTKSSVVPNIPQSEGNPAAADDSFYSVATNIPRADVESYAARVRQQFLEHDWQAIASEISYPITIADITYNNSTDFLDASNGFDSSLEEAFFTALEEEDCAEMFCNWQGIMLGETGQIWISEVLDAELNSQGLKIIAVNGMLKE